MPEYEFTGPVEIVISPTSCRCGGEFAYYAKQPVSCYDKRRGSHVETSLGCVCHHAVAVEPTSVGSWVVRVERVSFYDDGGGS